MFSYFHAICNSMLGWYTFSVLYLLILIEWKWLFVQCGTCAKYLERGPRGMYKTISNFEFKRKFDSTSFSMYNISVEENCKLLMKRLNGCEIEDVLVLPQGQKPHESYDGDILRMYCHCGGCAKFDEYPLYQNDENACALFFRKGDCSDIDGHAKIIHSNESVVNFYESFIVKEGFQINCSPCCFFYPGFFETKTQRLENCTQCVCRRSEV